MEDERELEGDEQGGGGRQEGPALSGEAWGVTRRPRGCPGVPIRNHTQSSPAGGVNARTS
eukprot:scaffold20206_cov34-Tisochrysis_lutea.AAC.1